MIGRGYGCDAVKGQHEGDLWSQGAILCPAWGYAELYVRENSELYAKRKQSFLLFDKTGIQGDSARGGEIMRPPPRLSLQLLEALKEVFLVLQQQTQNLPERGGRNPVC